MDSHYAAKLLRLAKKDPSRLVREKKFWKLELFPFYLRRCDDLLWDDPQQGVAFTRHAPPYAAKIAEANPAAANAADLMILAYSYLGGAYRRVGEYAVSEENFRHAGAYKESASPKALAEYLRRFAYLLTFQHRADALAQINEAIAIHKTGNLVHRHELGECLLCRGHAYFEFEQPGKSLEDLTAALNHLSFDKDPKPYYSALNNLAVWALEFGDEGEIREAITNLRSAKVVLNGYRHRHYAKYMLRWLLALLDSRIGKQGSAELSLLQVCRGFESLKLPYEVGLVQLDLARIYLAQNRREEVRRLVRETARLFRSLGNEASAGKALALWRRTFTQKVTQASLKEARERFFSRKRPIPAGIAA